MTVAEVVPVTAALALHRRARRAAAAGGRHRRWRLCGAMIGFAYFNRPVAQAFSRRCRQPADRPAARLAAGAARRPRRISPPRCCCRSTISPTRPSRSLRRLISGEPVWQAHRSHFYQRATDRRLYREPGGGACLLRSMSCSPRLPCSPSPRPAWSTTSLRWSAARPWSAGCCWHSRAARSECHRHNAGTMMTTEPSDHHLPAGSPPAR